MNENYSNLDWTTVAAAVLTFCAMHYNNLFEEG